MNNFSILIKHKSKDGMRDDVCRVWMMFMAPAVEANSNHLSYYYCLDNNNPNLIYAFQEYKSEEASKEFLLTKEYNQYLIEVEPFLEGPPEVSSLTPLWSKSYPL